MTIPIRTGRVLACLAAMFIFATAVATPPSLATPRSEATPASAGAADCLITVKGDVNGSGHVTSADIIRVLSFCFKGGLPPQPCLAAGDINCDGVLTTGDVIVLVNIVFKSSQTPCDICNESPLAANCN